MTSSPPGSARKRPAFPAQIDGLKPGLASPVQGKVAASIAPPLKMRTVAPVPTPSGLGLDSHAVRAAMVRKLVEQGLTHSGIQRAFAAVERHRFVDSGLVPQAYEDTSLPIGLGQTISKPSVVARMLELLLEGRRSPIGRVLEIGTGCGYQAALLSHLCNEVYSIERLRGLHERARENLRPFRLPNVHLILGDGMLGFPSGGPYAGIISAAGGDSVPQAWLDQLEVGGRLVAPAEFSPGKQSLVVITRTASGYTQSVLEPVLFVPLKSGIA